MSSLGGEARVYSQAEASGSLASVSSTASSHKFYKPVSDNVKGDPKCGLHQGFPDGSVIENPPANAGDLGSIPEWGRSPGGVHDSSILAWEIPWTEEPGGLQFTGLQKSWARLKD